MSTPSALRCLLPILALLVTTAGIAGAAGEYQLVESLGHQWTAELISFPVSFAAGQCPEIRSVTADEAAVPFQTADVTRHPDGSVATARVYVLTDLGPKQTSSSARSPSSLPPPCPLRTSASPRGPAR